jgi:EmrB/QacA subfamily drug resistance transporter
MSGGLQLNGRFPLPVFREKKGYHWYVVITVCVGAFMAALDASIINIALPTMQREFHLAMHAVEWVSLVYLLALAALIVPFGRLADMWGRRWMYAAGFGVFIIGSFACGESSSLWLLLVSRVFQAVGAAMLQANSVSIITAATPTAARGKAIGIQASAQGVGLSLGPVIGGALISLLNWRWIFFVNIPVGLIGTLLGILILPRDVPSGKAEGFDFWGAIFLTPAMVALIYVLNTGLEYGYNSPPILIGGAVAVVCFALFWRTEKRVSHPMVDLSLFSKPVFALGNLTGVISFAVMYAILLLAPFYLDHIDHIDTFRSGLYLSLIPIGMTIFTPLAGIIADRFGTRLPTVTGMAFAIAGSLGLSFMSGATSLGLFMLSLFLVGAGVGLFTPPNNSSVMGSAPRHRLGVAGGVLNMSRTLGMGLGVTLGGLSYQFFLSLYGVTESRAKHFESVLSFHYAYLVVSLVALSALAISALRRTNQAVQ